MDCFIGLEMQALRKDGEMDKQAVWLELQEYFETEYSARKEMPEQIKAEMARSILDDRHNWRVIQAVNKWRGNDD